MNWIPHDTPAVADIIRWNEPVWAAPTKKRGKPDKIGEQQVTATVTAVGDVIELQVQAVAVLSLDEGVTPPPGVQVGDNLRRKPSTISRGDCHKQV